MYALTVVRRVFLGCQDRSAHYGSDNVVLRAKQSFYFFPF